MIDKGHDIYKSLDGMYITNVNIDPIKDVDLVTFSYDVIGRVILKTDIHAYQSNCDIRGKYRRAGMIFNLYSNRSMCVETVQTQPATLWNITGHVDRICSASKINIEKATLDGDLCTSEFVLEKYAEHELAVDNRLKELNDQYDERKAKELSEAKTFHAEIEAMLEEDDSWIGKIFNKFIRKHHE